MLITDLLPSSSGSLVPIYGTLPPQHERIYIGKGTETADTIAIMQKMASRGKRDDNVRRQVGAILNGDVDGIPAPASKDYFAYAKALYTFARDKIKYAYDPLLVEYVEAPRRVLRNRIADCDSIDVLLVSMFENIGLEAEYVTVAADPERKDEFSHVYVRVKIPNYGWVVADPTMPSKYFGWEPSQVFLKKYWHGSTDTLSMPLDESDSISMGMNGLGASGRPRMRKPRGPKLDPSVLAQLQNFATKLILDQHFRESFPQIKNKGQYVSFIAQQIYQQRPAYIQAAREFAAQAWDAWEASGQFEPPTTVFPVALPLGGMGNCGNCGPKCGCKGCKDAHPHAEFPGIYPLGVGMSGRPGTGIPNSYPMGMNGLGDTVEEINVWSIINGDALDSINQMKEANTQTVEKLDSILASIQKIPAGAARNNAQAKYNLANAAYTQQFVRYRTARDNYNSFITQAKTYLGSFGYNPAMAGLGIAPAVVVAIIGGLIGAAALANAIANDIAAWNNNQNATRGYIDQAAEAIKQAGIAFDLAAKGTSNALTTAAWVGGLGLIAYAIYANRGAIKTKLKF